MAHVLPDEKARAMMPAVKAAFAAYQKDMENTLRLVDGVKDIQLSHTTIQLRDAAVKSRDSAEELQSKIKTVAEDLEIGSKASPRIPRPSTNRQVT